MARPAEVLSTYVAIVRLGALAIYRVGRVTLWASNALAEGKGKSLGALSLVEILILAHHTVFVGADEAVGHPLLLINELVVALSNAAN